MNIERKSFQTELKTAGDEGIVEAIVSVFNNVDSVGDRVKFGFFDESLSAKMPKGVWQHDWNTPVAKTLEARELMAGDALLPANLRDLGGLYIKGKFNMNTQAGRETFSNIKEGIIDEFSIGYTVSEEAYASDGARELIKGRLYEWSPVLFGANPATAVLGVKSGLNDDVQTVTSEIARLMQRLNERSEIRQKEGRTLSSANVARLSSLLDTLSTAVTDLKSLIDTATPTNAKAALEMERLRSVINAKRN
jgi:HK97 family phage prohead protease